MWKTCTLLLERQKGDTIAAHDREITKLKRIHREALGKTKETQRNKAL